MKIAFITGLLKKVWNIIRPLLKSTLLNILEDKAALALAEKTIERYARVDLDGDGKFDHAVADLQAEFKQLGLTYSHAAISMLVQTVYESLKSKGVVD